MAARGLSKLLTEYDEFLRFGDEQRDRHAFPSGVIGLNYALNCPNGIPGGSMVQLIGEPSQGKSTLALDFIANAQKTGLKELEIPAGKNGTRIINAVYVDFEHSFDAVYAKTIGVDLSKLLVVETQWGEQGFMIVEYLLTDGIQMVVFDSIAMFVSQSEEDKELTENEKMATNAGPLSRALKRLLHLSDYADALVILINQYRANFEPMARKKKKAFGARTLQHVIKATIELRRIETKAERASIEAFISKNKLGIEGRKIYFDICFGKGINYNQHILNYAVEFGIVRKSGAWYYYDDIKAQGEERACQLFDFEKLRQLVLMQMSNKQFAVEDVDSDEDE